MQHYNRSDLIRNFVIGVYPDQVFGIDRRSAAAEIAAVLAGIKPTDDDRLFAALCGGKGDGPASLRIAAYDNGSRWFREAYYGEASLFQF